MAVQQSYMPLQRSLPLGLLTTINDLQPEFKIRYQTDLYKPKTKLTIESPLDLSVKTFGGVPTPPTTPSPLKKRYRDETFSNDENDSNNQDMQLSLVKQKEETPKKHKKTISVAKSSIKNPPPAEKKESKKQHKAVRKLKFDEKKSSPVSGTIIRPLEEIDENCMEQSGDIDPQYNIVEVTDEAKAELAEIQNVIGAYICKLCRIEFEDAFGLARHRCSCIVLLEYRCPECGKRFNCPANLASHRRWHKPRDQVIKKNDTSTDLSEQFPCSDCGKFFKRQAYLRKHQLTHRKDIINSSDSSSRDSTTTAPKIVFYMDNSSHSSISPLNYDNEMDLSNSHVSAKFRVLDGNFTEDENIAVAALAHLRNGASVIKHTTALAV